MFGPTANFVIYEKGAEGAKGGSMGKLKKPSPKGERGLKFPLRGKGGRWKLEGSDLI